MSNKNLSFKNIFSSKLATTAHDCQVDLEGHLLLRVNGQFPLKLSLS